MAVSAIVHFSPFLRLETQREENLFIFTEVMFCVLGLLEVYQVPAVLAQEAVQDREDREQSDEHEAGNEDRTGEV